MKAVNMPNFLVVGAQRCGTTWLHENLRTHPDVFLPAQKELNYFSDIKSNWHQGNEWYFKQFEGAAKCSAIGEITPEYFVDLAAPERIKSLLGNIRIVCILRDPLERAYSSYKKGLRELNWDCSFDEFIEGNIDLSVTRGLYAPQLERFISAFGKENVLILSYDQIDANPHEFLRSIYRFLRVSDLHKSPMLESAFNVGSSGNILIRTVVSIRNVVYKIPGGRALVKGIQRTKLGNILMKKFLKSQSTKNRPNYKSLHRALFEKDREELMRRYEIGFVRTWK